MTDESTIAKQIKQFAHQSPFRPFKVELSNGEAFEVTKRFRTMVWHDRVVFGIEMLPKDGVDSRMKVVLLKDITSVELQGATA